MIEFHRIVLSNGLRVIVHEDRSTPMIAVNIVYKVGSKYEDPQKTGFAHLFEHLMFGGSEHVDDFDEQIQEAGGDNNAFTNSDLTNFYNVVPAQNIETALWLESDRMNSLSFSQKSLDTQKSVVVEEFKETCLNEPYGDMWHHLSQLAYERHPYRWPTIGREMSHISDATLDEVRSFFYRYYRPDNAVLCLAGNLGLTQAESLVQKWFDDIPAGGHEAVLLPQEPAQKTFRQKVLYSDVPHDALYRGYHMGDRLSDEYYACDLLSDVLAQGRSSRFYQRLYKEQQLFSTIDAFISGTIEPGLFIVEGKNMPGISIEKARSAIRRELEILATEPIPERELTKLQNSVESSLTFGEVSVLNKAISLAYFEALGDASLINDETERYRAITPQLLMETAVRVFSEDNCSEVVYIAKESPLEIESIAAEDQYD